MLAYRKSVNPYLSIFCEVFLLLLPQKWNTENTVIRYALFLSPQTVLTMQSFILHGYPGSLLLFHVPLYVRLSVTMQVVLLFLFFTYTLKFILGIPNYCNSEW